MNEHEHADGINHEELNASNSNALPDSEVDDLLNELTGLMEADDSDASDGEYDPDEPPYPRDVTFHFPEDVGHLYGKTYVTVPIREVLTWMAANYPESGDLLTGIRDDFYCGDYSEDYIYQIDSGPMYLLNPEELAEVRLKQQQQALLSKERAAVLQKEWLADYDSCSEPEEVEEPVESDEVKSLKKRASSEYHSLEAAWDEFVKKPSADRDPKVRESLMQREALLEDLYRKIYNP